MVTGHKEIDKEHKEVIKDAKAVFKAIKSAEEKGIIRSLDNFRTHIEIHFKHEEDLMEKYKIKQLDGHRKLHENYLELVDEIYTSYTKTLSTSQLKNDFKTACNVMTKHIINYDIPVFEQIQAKMGNV